VAFSSLTLSLTNLTTSFKTFLVSTSCCHYSSLQAGGFKFAPISQDGPVTFGNLAIVAHLLRGRAVEMEEVGHSAMGAEAAEVKLPQKRYYRQRAHANPMSDHELVYPRTPDE
jgi:hypothetical protein